MGEDVKADRLKIVWEDGKIISEPFKVGSVNRFTGCWFKVAVSREILLPKDYI
jgi:hypothetical protein